MIDFIKDYDIIEWLITHMMKKKQFCLSYIN